MTALTVLSLLVFCNSCEQALERPLIDKKVILLAPHDALATPDTIVTFYWENIPEASRYQLQIVSPRFDAMARLETDTIINRNQITQELSAGNYQWRVRALQSDENTSQYSDTFNLSIQ